MESSPSRFPRRPPRIEMFQDQRPFYFVTFNTAARRPLLAQADTLRALIESGERGYAEHGVAIGRFVLMPDHAHLFVVLPESGVMLDRWMKALKRTLGSVLKQRGEVTPFWQEGFFDHVLRNGESYSTKWEYVRLNPVRAGLCARAENWPYQGEIIPLRF